MIVFSTLLHLGLSVLLAAIAKEADNSLALLFITMQAICLFHILIVTTIYNRNTD